MDILSGIILGIVQGLTEFLPISSSGHLIITREFLGLNIEHALSVDAVLHFATAFAVLIYFRKDFLNLIQMTWRWIRGLYVETKDKHLIVALIIGTLPAVFLGMYLEDYIGTTFRSMEVVAWGLIVGSILFLVAEYISKRITQKKGLKGEVSAKSGLIIGFFQALALIPGMSRSGATISGGLILGLTREEAARFAFLLSFPIILGAGSKSALDLGISGVFADIGVSILAAAISAFVAGFFAIHFLLRYLKTHTLNIFVVYRLALAVLILMYLV